MPEKSIKLTDPSALRGYAHPLRMSLLGLLRREGPMTATRAAAALGDNVPNCSFHLRQLAKYGLVERVPGADARERPWQATAPSTAWDDDSDDPAMRAAADQLTTVVVGQHMRRAEAYLAMRAGEPAEWRRAAGVSDALLYCTPSELVELVGQIDALLERFDARRADPASRPEGSRAVQLVYLAMPLAPLPTGGEVDRR